MRRLLIGVVLVAAFGLGYVLPAPAADLKIVLPADLIVCESAEEVYAMLDGQTWPSCVVLKKGSVMYVQEATDTLVYVEYPVRGGRAWGVAAR